MGIPATRLYIPSFIELRSGVSELQGVKIWPFPLLWLFTFTNAACTTVQAVMSSVFISNRQTTPVVIDFTRLRFKVWSHLCQTLVSPSERCDCFVRCGLIPKATTLYPSTSTHSTTPFFELTCQKTRATRPPTVCEMMCQQLQSESQSTVCDVVQSGLVHCV